jgi:anti-sigma regulatory factor (Ser/Thr protein kinase)
MPYASFPEHSVTLSGDDIVVLYTDGLVEVRGEPLDEGLERLAAAVRGAHSPDAACDRAMGQLLTPEGSADDVALVAAQCTSVPERLSMRLPADPTVLADMRHMLRRWLAKVGAGVEDVGAITLACGEACANAIEHAYSPALAAFEVSGDARCGLVTVAVRDSGNWRPPRGENRGRGLTIMEATMDDVEVRPTESGTEVVMQRRLRGAE